MQNVDALVVGAGPAGLTAALYLHRFRRRIVVVDDGRSRALSIPLSRNCPGFAHGVSGAGLIRELRAQGAAFGMEVTAGTVTSLRRSPTGFEAAIDGASLAAAAVVLATGIDDRLPPLDDVQGAIRRGIVRLCAVCDAFETSGQRVAVYGPSRSAPGHARYLRAFCERVHVLVSDTVPIAPDDAAELARLGIDWSDAGGLQLAGPGLRAMAADGSPLEFDALYPYLGSDPRTSLATGLGAACDAAGALRTDSAMQTSVPGLYAIGDVVSALNQVAVAMGHAAIAATAVHNRLPHVPLGAG